MAGIQLKVQSSGRTKRSKISRIKCSDTARAQVWAKVRPMLPSGHPAPTYSEDWLDYFVQGCISFEAFVLYLLGDKVRGHTEAFHTGVRRRSGKFYEKLGGDDAPVKPLGNFKHTFDDAMKADNDTIVKWFKTAGIMS